VTVAVITGSPGPRSTHVPVGAASGLTKYDEPYVNCTDLHTVAKSRLRRRLGPLSAAELTRVEENLGLILGVRR
jgi:mRNA interferase MazF